jgi:hypothetical protein
VSSQCLQHHANGRLRETQKRYFSIGSLKSTANPVKAIKFLGRCTAAACKAAGFLLDE